MHSIAPYKPLHKTRYTHLRTKRTLLNMAYALGSSLLLLLLGCVREWLSAGTVFGHVLSRPVLPMASMPAGGFIVLGVLCAVWRTLAGKYKNYLTSEARGLMAVYRQKEGEPEDE